MLTKNGIAAIFGDHKNHPSFHAPVVQIVNTKKITGAPATAAAGSNNAAAVPERYRLILSDGEHYCQGMLATQMNPLMQSGEITKNSIVKLNKFVFNNVAADKKLASFTVLSDPSNFLWNRTRVAIVLDLSVVQSVYPEKIGEPVNVETVPSPISDVPEQKPATPTKQGGAQAIAQQFATVPQSNPYGQQQQQNPYAASSPQASSSQGHSVPIQNLNPYSNRWQIKARVSVKSDIKHYTNARGDGKLFNVTFTDESVTFHF